MYLFRANAAIHFYPPQPINITTADNIILPFGSSDIKALLSYYAAMHVDRYTPTPTVGQRCNYRNNADNTSNVKCVDTNAGSFHLMLSNMLGLRKNSFVFDRDNGFEVCPIIS